LNSKYKYIVDWLTQHSYALLYVSFTLYILLPVNNSFSNLFFYLFNVAFSLLVFLYAVKIKYPRMALKISLFAPIVMGLIKLPEYIIEIFTDYNPGDDEQLDLAFKLNYYVVQHGFQIICLLYFFFLYRHGENSKLETKEVNIVEPSFKRFIVIIYSVIVLIQTLTNGLESGFFEYVFQILATIFILLPFFIGRWKKELGQTVFTIAIIAILVKGSIVVLSGGRFGAILPILILFYGFLLQLDPKARVKWVSVFLIIGIPIGMVFVGVSGIVRDQIGRGGIEVVQQEGRVSEFGNTFSEVFNAYLSGDVEVLQQIDEQSSGRLNSSASILENVLTKTPTEVPYRGFDNIDFELNEIFNLVAFSGDVSIDNINEKRTLYAELEIGHAAANRYGGYAVSATNSVEWSIAADAFSRGGYLIVLIYLLIAVALIDIVELLISKNFKDSTLKLLSVATLVSISYFDFNSQPLFLNIRYIILNSIASLIFVKGVVFVYNQIYYKKLN
jgi:hypothetical protein